MFLGKPERSLFPVTHLLFFADLFIKDRFANCRQTKASSCLKVWFNCFIEILNLHDPWDVFVKTHLWTILPKLWNVSWKTEAKHGTVGVHEDLFKHIIKFWAWFEGDDVNNKRMFFSCQLQNWYALSLVKQVNLRAPFWVAADVLLTN